MNKIISIIIGLGVLVGFSCRVCFAEDTEWFEEEFWDTTAENGKPIDSLEDVGLGSAGRVFMEGVFLDHDILKISVNISEIQTPVLGIAFHLEYEPELLSFLRYDPGSFLEEGGDPFYLVQNETDKLIFGETLRRNDGFPVGEGVIAVFYFQQMDTENPVYKFIFHNGVVSTLDTIRQDIDHIEFEDLELDETVMAEIEDQLVEAGSVYSANVAGSVKGLDGIVIWLILGLGVLFAAVFWYFFKAKIKRKFADLNEAV